MTTLTPVDYEVVDSELLHVFPLLGAKALCKRVDFEGAGGRRLTAWKLRNGGPNRRIGATNTLAAQSCRTWPRMKQRVGP